MLPRYCEKEMIPASIVEIVVRTQIPTRKARILNINFEVRPGIL
jgi:hypothetical protein